MGGGGERMLGVRGEAGLVRADGPPTAVVPGSASGWDQQAAARSEAPALQLPKRPQHKPANPPTSPSPSSPKSSSPSS